MSKIQQEYDSVNSWHTLHVWMSTLLCWVTKSQTKKVPLDDFICMVFQKMKLIHQEQKHTNACLGMEKQGWLRRWEYRGARGIFSGMTGMFTIMICGMISRMYVSIKTCHFLKLKKQMQFIACQFYFIKTVNNLEIN